PEGEGNNGDLALSRWERDGVRVRSIAGETKEKEFLSSRAVRSIAGETKEKEFLSSRAVRSIAGETKEKEFLSSRAVNPHPDPLPEGEGVTTANRSLLTAYSLSWLSEHAWMSPPAQA